MATAKKPTQAQIVAAVKKVMNVKTSARKKNPAPRIGTKKPNRASQITGKKPTKRLVKRRKENKVAGYFPNPSEIGAAHAIPRLPYFVQADDKRSMYKDIAAFSTITEAKKFATDYAQRYSVTVRVIRFDDKY